MSRWPRKPFGPIDRCQVCDGARLSSVLPLGFLPPVNRMTPIGRSFDQEPWFPAEMLYCADCHLVQLGFAVEPHLLFPLEYPYTSGTTRILRDNFADLYRESSARIGLRPEDLVVDVGSNDGTLLSNFKDGGHRVYGIEPSLTAELALARGISTLMTFFDRAAVDKVTAEQGQAKLVTACNVFAHIHNIHHTLEDVEALLRPDGVFITESHYLRDLVETLQYDTIYHEHLRFYSLTSLRALLERHGFRVFFARRIPTHGGSIRVYASKSTAYAVDASVERILGEETAAGLAGPGWIDGFRERVRRSKLELYALIEPLKRAGARIYGIGAPSRASTLITYVGLDELVLDCVMEVTGSKKLDKYVPGKKIPVLDEAKLYADQPEYALLLSWHIGDELARNLKRRGFRGDFIVPLPEPRVLRNADVA